MSGTRNGSADGEVSMSEQTRQEMEVVERLEDIPAFVTEEEEHRY
jgi:hypothetical protein